MRYRVVDPETLVAKLGSLRDAMYAETQLAVRHLVAGVTVDRLLEERAAHATEMIERVRTRARSWGVEVLSLDIKDLVLPGDMRTLLNQVIEAEKRAAARVSLRREEVAATRSLANTAKILESNPVLLKLKELETFKDLAERIPKLTVVVGAEQLVSWLRIDDG